MDFIAKHSGEITSVFFFSMFVIIAFWAYLPRNKKKLQEYGNIPFKGDEHGR